jgi:hypothetical protein
MGLAECLETDWALVCNFVPGRADYWEGVRARLIDKDGSPRWKYAQPEDVPAALVDELLRLPPGQRRLGLREAEGGGGGGGAAGGAAAAAVRGGGGGHGPACGSRL